MNIKGNTRIEGEAVVESLPISASSLSTLVEVGGLLHKRQFSDIVLQPKEAYIPGLSVSFPSIFNLNTESLDYNNRSLVVSLKNQLAGTALLAPVAMNGTPAFRRIVKSDLTDAAVVFTDDSRINNWNTAYNWGDHSKANYKPASRAHTDFVQMATYVSVKTPTMLAGQYYEFWNTGIGWSDIRAGVITSNGNGDSTQWNQAYKWGDFRDFGLDKYKTGFTSQTLPNNTGFYFSTDATPTINGNIHNKVINLGNTTNSTIVGSIFLSHHNSINRISFRGSQANTTNEIWHDGNLTKLSQLQNDLSFLNDGDVKLPLRDSDFKITTKDTASENFDWNTKSDAGFYKNIFNNGGNAYNAPKNGSGYWFLYNTPYSNGQNLTQFAYPYRVQDGMYMRNRFSGTWSDWVQFYHSGNLNKFTKTIDGLVPAPTGTTSTRFLREDGTWVVPTNTTYSVITPAELDGGIATTGRLVSSKNLNDWVNTKIKPSVLEYTLQEGITNPLWSSNATGKYSIAIGSYSNSTGYNSLALLQGARAEGFSSLAIGEYSQALGSRSVAVGSYVTSINESYSFGFAITNTQSGCVAIGEFNADVPFGDGKAKNNNSETPLFVVGNGLSSMIRSNAKVLYRDGSTRNYGRQYYDEAMRSTIDFTKDNTLVDVKYVSENGGGGLPNNPFQLPNRYVGDVIKNPSFVNNNIPADETLVTLFVEPLKNNNWTPYGANKENFGLVGMYLKSENVVLLRGYYKTVKFSNNTMFSPLWYDFQNDTVNLQNYIPDISKAKYLGTFIDKDAKTIFFNPR